MRRSRSTLPLGLLTAVVLFALWAWPAYATPGHADPADPPEQFTLTDLGLLDQVLRGGTTSIDLFFPGPGRYQVTRSSTFTLIFSYAEIVDPAVSTVSVHFNSVPLRTWLLTSELTGIQEVAVAIPPELVAANINLVQVRFILRIKGDICGSVDHPSLTATVYRQTRLSYGYQAGFPRNPPGDADLGQFPTGLLTPGSVQQNQVALVVPDDASTSEIQAVADVSAASGRYAGGRPLSMQLFAARNSNQTLASGHAVSIGRPSRNPYWRSAPDRAQGTPISRVAGEPDMLRGFDGEPLKPTDGALMLVPSPWSPDFMVLIVTGPTDQAVVRAARALGATTARTLLAGNAAIITEDLAPAGRDGRDTDVTLNDFTLADIGLQDRIAQGWGTHRLNVIFDALAVPTRAATATIIYDHSRVINNAISSIAVHLNDIPLRDARLDPGHVGRLSLDVELPPRLLRTGRNTLAVQFYFAQHGSAVAMEQNASDKERVCGHVPPELAWGVLYADSIIHLPPGGTAGIGLGSFPFPFVREGRADDLLVVLPDGVLEGPDLPRLAAEFGRLITTDVLTVPVVRASQLTPEQRQRSNLAPLGLASNNPLIQQLEDQLPLSVEPSGRVVQITGEPVAGVADNATLGILETLPSPFNVNRAVLVVTGTNPRGVRLAVDGLIQGGLQGNVALVQPPEAGTTRVQIRTLEVRAAPTLKDTLPVEQAAPAAVAILAGLGVLAIIGGTGVIIARTAARRRGMETQAVTPWDAPDDWLADEEPVSNRQ